MQSESKFEAFVFYSQADQQWTQKVLIPQLGLDPTWIATPDSVLPGETLVNAFERLIETSRFTFLVLSPNLMGDNWGQFVQNLGKHLAVEEQSNRIVPIIRTAINAPVGLRSKMTIDLESPAAYESGFRALRSLLSTSAPRETPAPCPYPGMLPFSSELTDHFYGRRQEVEKVVARLRYNQRRLFIIGPSGSGKSSLVQAGVIPRLRTTTLFTPEHWLVINLRPGLSPMQTLISEVQAALNSSASDVSDILSEGQPQSRRVLLVLDQFEEVFAHRDRKSYLASLKRIEQDPRFLLMPVMRADFYADLMESELWPISQSEKFEVIPLRGKALREAIEQPALQSGVVIDPALVDRLLSEAACEPGVLPLLQETLSRLWDNVQHHYLPLQAYAEATAGFENGLAVIFSDRADSVFDQLPVDQQQIARRIFLGLVREGRGRPDTRQQRPADDLRTAFDEPALFERTLDHLAKNRLITLTSSIAGATRTIDLAHEALIMTWKRIRDWLTTYREAQATRDRLESKADEWVRLHHAGGFLDRYELEEAKHWLDDPLSQDIGFSSRLRELVEASANVLHDLQRTEEERLKEIALAAQKRAEAERHRAEEARKRAEEERRLRLRSVALALASHARQRIEDRERSLLMAVQAYIFDLRSEGGVSDQVDLALRSALKQDDMLLALDELSGKRLSNLCLSPDGLTLIAAYTDEPPSYWKPTEFTFLYMWSLSNFEVISFPERKARAYCGLVHEFSGSLQSLAFAANSQIMAALDAAGKVWIFSLDERGRKPLLKFTKEGFPELDTTSYWSRARPLRQSIRFTNEFEITPDGDEYLSEATRVIMDRYQLDLSRSFSVGGMTPQMNRIVASPDERHICFEVHGRPPQETRIVKLDSALPREQNLGVYSTAITFSGDGKRLYIIADGCRAWDLSSWPPVSVPCGLPESEISREDLLVSDRDRGTLACGLANGRIWVWRTRPEATSAIVCELPENYDTLALSPDGGAVAVWISGPEPAGRERVESELSQILFLDTARYQIKHEKSQLEEAAYHACGDYYRTHWGERRSSDPTYFWYSAERLTRILHSQRKLLSYDTSARRLVETASGEWAIATWFLKQDGMPAKCAPLSIAKGSPLALGSTDEGSFVAIAHQKGVGILKPDGTNTSVLAFSQEPTYSGIIWAGFDLNCVLLAVQPYSQEWPNKTKLHNVQLYKLRHAESKPIELKQSAKLCTSIAFDSTGTKLALGLVDRRLDRNWAFKDPTFVADAGSVTSGAILLYDLTVDGTAPQVLAGPRGDITALAFSADGALLGGGSSNGKIVVYRLTQGSRPIFLDDHAGPILSLRFLASGRMLSASLDGTIRLWIIDVALETEIAMTRISRNFSKAEWNYYVGEGIEYEKTCQHLPVSE
jgi:WD40 repeat protein